MADKTVEQEKPWGKPHYPLTNRPGMIVALSLCRACLSAAVRGNDDGTMVCSACGFVHPMDDGYESAPLSSNDEDGCMAVAKTLPFHDDGQLKSEKE